MIFEHLRRTPQIHETAYIAPNATVIGDVVVGPSTRVLFGAVLTAESGPVAIGAYNIIMEHAVLRGVSRDPLRTGDHVLVGPRAHLTGCTLERNVFAATGTTIFNGAHIGARSEIQINGVVHLNSLLEADTTVPISWVAVGNPAQLFSPDQHEQIWSVQRELQFPQRVFGVKRADPGATGMPEITRRYSHALGRYSDAAEVDI
jgi:carbonic anhydrase/acetyltransferase-like protein (isoleucine patch superfamily)